MKKLLLSICLGSILIGCGGLGSSYEHSFKDQSLQGKIGGKTWEMNAGKASVSVRDSVVSWSFGLTDKKEKDNPCGFVHYDLGKVMFSTGNVDKGVKKLKMGFDFSKNQTITLVYDQDSAKGPMNKIATQGAFEILEVDTTEGHFIKGRMDVYVDDNNWVNGTFKAKYCPN